MPNEKDGEIAEGNAFTNVSYSKSLSKTSKAFVEHFGYHLPQLSTVRDIGITKFRAEIQDQRSHIFVVDQLDGLQRTSTRLLVRT